jgi:hypothetical protein
MCSTRSYLHQQQQQQQQQARHWSGPSAKLRQVGEALALAAGA